MRPAAFFAFASTTMLGACVLDDVDAPTPVETDTAGRTSSNAYTKNAYTKNAYTKNAYTKNALSAAALTDPATRCETARYLARCALRPDQVFELDGCGEVFPGGLGLADYWMDAALTDHDAGWIQACLTVHVNPEGVSEALSVRGPAPSLATDEAERAMFGVPELAAYPGGDGRIHLCSMRPGLVYAGDSRAALLANYLDPFVGYDGPCLPNSGLRFSAVVPACGFEDEVDGFAAECGDQRDWRVLSTFREGGGSLAPLDDGGAPSSGGGGGGLEL